MAPYRPNNQPTKPSPVPKIFPEQVQAMDIAEPEILPNLVELKLMERFRSFIEEAFPESDLPANLTHGNRKLSHTDYLCAFFFNIFTPLHPSMRGQCAATEGELFRKKFNLPEISPSVFSRMQRIISADKFPAHIKNLCAEVLASKDDKNDKNDKSVERTPSGERVDKKMANFILNVSDSTVFKALPSMVWALFGAGRKRNDGKKTASVRFHVGFDPIGLLPSGCTATSAAVDEKKEWPNIQIKPTDGDQRIAVEVADRNYPSKYQTLGELSEKGVNYVCRGKEGLQFELVEELSLSESERAMGIERHAWVHLGSDDYRQRNKNLVRARLVWLRAESGKLVLLITNLREEDAPAEIICEMYRLRWQIEFFFWWLKKVMKGGGHWLARSENGVKTQLYLTMILSLMLHKVTGRRPSKRMLETIQLWTLGLASDEEVQSQLKKHKEQAEIARKSAQARYQKKKAAVKELANEAAKKS